MKQAVLAGPLVSAIIPTHNRIDALKRAITSLSKQNYSNLEVIVVDDGSDVPVDLGFDSCRILRSEQSKGACYSRNAGCAIANGDLLLYLDDDTEIPDAFCISRAVSWLQAHPEVAAVGFAQLNPDGSLQKEQIVEPTRSYYVHTFWSYGCLIRKGVQRQVGGFNELFGYYYEEEELSLKFRAAGYQVAFVPSLQIIHYRDPSNRTWSKLFTLLTRNAIISSIQHFPVWLLCPFVLRTLLNYSKLIAREKKSVPKHLFSVLAQVIHRLPVALRQRQVVKTKVLYSSWKLKSKPVPI